MLRHTLKKIKCLDPVFFLDNVANIVKEVQCNSSTNMLYLIYESIGQIKQYVHVKV